MQVQFDKSHEARNLIVVSLGIILFFLSDAKMVNDSIKIGIINIELQRVWVVATFVWLILFWFLFRFWQANKHGLEKVFNEILSKTGSEYEKHHAIESFRLLLEKKHSLNIRKVESLLYQENLGWFLKVFIENPTDEDSFNTKGFELHNIVKGGSRKVNEYKLVLSGNPDCKKFKKTIKRAMLLRETEPLGIIVPYLLCFTAIVLGVIELTKLY